MNMATSSMQLGITYTLTPSLFLSGQPLLYSPALLHAQLPSEREINLETSLKDLQDKYEALLLENQDLKNKLEQSTKKTSPEEGKTQNACARRSFVRRTEDQLDKKFKCCFDHCKKEYASTLALNLHIKNKHHGATKKQMDDQARKVIEAELRGEQPPSLPFSLPQGYLEKLRKEYTAAPSTSEDLPSLQQ